jgi:hypothetical protein
MGPATAPAAKKTLRRAPLRLISENMLDRNGRVLREVEVCLVAKVLKVLDGMNDMRSCEDDKAFFICRVPSQT